jgi:hypothetical protein
MANTHVTFQAEHMPGMEDVTNQAAVFAHVKTVPVTGDNTSSILATVLKNSQTVIQ